MKLTNFRKNFSAIMATLDTMVEEAYAEREELLGDPLDTEWTMDVLGYNMLKFETIICFPDKNVRIFVHVDNNGIYSTTSSTTYKQ